MQQFAHELVYALRIATKKNMHLAHMMSRMKGSVVVSGGRMRLAWKQSVTLCENMGPEEEDL